MSLFRIHLSAVDTLLAPLTAGWSPPMNVPTLQLINPVTGAQLALPPPQSMKGVRPSFNNDGVLIGHYIHTLSVKYPVE